MNCPQCASTTTKEQTKQTSLGSRTFRERLAALQALRMVAS